jgi:hypothetical protein
MTTLLFQDELVGRRGKIHLKGSSQCTKMKVIWRLAVIIGETPVIVRKNEETILKESMRSIGRG